MKIEAVLTAYVLAFGCKPESPHRATLNEQLRGAKQSPNHYVRQEGVGKAYITFADEDAMLLGNSNAIW